MIVLSQPIEIEITARGRTIEDIHDGLRTIDGFSGVTFRDGRAYVTYSGDKDSLRARETLIERRESRE